MRGTPWIRALAVLGALSSQASQGACLTDRLAWERTEGAKLHQLIEETRRELPGLKMPDEIEVIPTERFQRALTEAGDYKNAIIVIGSEPSTAMHELGHVVFDHNLFQDESLEMSRDLMTYRKRWDELMDISDRDRAEVALRKKTDGETAALEAAIRANETSREKLKKQFSHIVGVPRSQIVLRYSELFADALSFAKTGLADGNVDRLTAAHIAELGEKPAKDAQRARHFFEPVDPTEWKDEYPYTDPHVYFGPANSFIGNLLKDISPSERMRFIPVLYKAIVRDLKKATAQISLGHYKDVRTPTETNLDLMQAIQSEAAEAHWPR